MSSEASPPKRSACCADFDDREFWRHELETRPKSWRTEAYARSSHVLILDHDQGKPEIQYRTDEDIQRLLDPKQSQPQVRFVLLEPTPHKRILHDCKNINAEELIANELIAEDPNDVVNIWPMTKDAINAPGSQLNISENMLRAILERYDIAPATASHIRGQEQIFGSRISSDKDGTVNAFEFWYAVRARAYFRQLGAEADLKITVVTRFDAKTQKTVVLLKYRSFNDLPSLLQAELTEKLKGLVRQGSTAELAEDPFALCMFIFSSTVQYYRRGARDPRDTIRNEEKTAHEKPDDVDLRMIHTLLGSLDQDKIQLNFILELICGLRKLHDVFYRRVKQIPNPDKRGWLYTRVEEDFERFDNQIKYFRNSVQDVAARAQRLLDLLFNLSTRRNSLASAKMAEQAMYESASMTTISVVTMLFLPGSFVAGILGTNFFSGPSQPSLASGNVPVVLSSDDRDKGLYVSDEWWLLLAIIGPMTVLTFTGWYMWKVWMRQKIKKSLHSEALV